MDKIHISLIGAQPLPVYNGITYSDADYVFLLHSEGTKRVAENIASNWKGGLNLIPIEEPFDYLYCKTVVEEIVDEYKPGQFSFNITGGTKIMSLAAYDVAKENKMSTIYIDQNNIVTELDKNKQYILKNPIDLAVYFRMFGQLAKITTKYESLDERLFDLKNFLKGNYNNLKPLFKQFRNKKYSENVSFTLKNKRYELGWRKKEQIVFIFNQKTGIEQQFQGWHVFNIVFRTGWFELDVAQMLAKWKHTERIYLNTIFERRHDKSDKNEIDIIVDTGVKMFFFECKTSVYDIRDIDKFRNVVKIFGGLAAKPVLVTLHKPNKNIIEKCDDLNIKVFWLSENSTTQFLNFLNNQLETINPI